MPEIKKILVIRLSSFGDIVLSFPFISSLKKYFPGAAITYLTKDKFKQLLEMNKDIGKILSYKDESMPGLRRLIKEENFDLIFDIHRNLRSVFSTAYLKPEIIRYRKGTLKKLLLVLFKLNLIKNVVPVYRRYLVALHNVHFINDFNFAPTGLIFDKEPLIKEPAVLIAPSSKHFSKTLPKEYFAEIIKCIKGHKIILTGDNSEADKSICGFLESLSKNTINLCGKTDFNSLANIIYNSKLVICNDSGVLHLAEALNKKIIAFFGSTVKEFGFFPQLSSTVVFENNNLKCRPCTHIGKDKCQKRHFKCMRDFKMNEIINKINENIS
ncbi:MAG: glycosyltransferase family 9 protein [Ignavibacteriae bacterium]|nr:glycosyltransferase family 9 protein [Ignavibacteriota bacterium]